MAEPIFNEAEVAESNKVGEASGMGPVNLETPESDEKPEEIEEEQPADEPKEPEKTSTRESRRASEEEDGQEEDEEESEDEEEEDGEDEEDSKSQRPAKTVPYGLHKADRAKIKELKKQLAIAQGNADESGDDEDVSEAAELARELGEELGLDAKGLEKILMASKKLNKGKFELPKDLAKKLARLDEIDAREKINDETAHFENEWKTTATNLKKQFPNAPESALLEAKSLMDKLAHSKEFHKYDLDYVLFKNMGKFQTLLKVAGKSKSTESGKSVREADIDVQDDDDAIVNIEDMSPAIMKAREAKSMGTRQGSPKDYRVQNPVK